MAFCVCALASALAPAAAAQSAVQAAPLTPLQWRDSARLTATLAAPEDATLAAARGGVATQVLFQSGQAVQAGQVLVVLDVGPEQAQLQVDQAKLVQAGRDLARTEKLMSISGASQAALDVAQATQEEAKAQIALDEATLAQGEIIAPFAGIAGIRKLDPGDYVQAGQAVVSLTAPGPLKVYFDVPQAEEALMQPGESFTFTAPRGGGGTASGQGHVVALSPAVDAATDAQGVEGLMNAADPALLAGMNGVVDIATGAPRAAFSVPSTALTDSMLGPYLFAILPAAKGDVLHTVYVKILGTQGDASIVTAPGLQAGQLVVAVGGFQLNDGDAVSVATP